MNIMERPRVYWNGSYWAVRKYHIVTEQQSFTNELLRRAYAMAYALNMSN